MAQHSHVPKFGNWEGDNVPYTVYFENARKEKGGGVRMNPNDPEDNPEAFMFGAGGATSSPSVQPQNNSEKSTLTGNSQVERHKASHHRHKNSSQRSITSESSSEKSNSDNSIHLANRRTRSDRKKSINEGSSGSGNVFSPSPGPNRMRSESNPLTDTPLRAASVPMFGAWDESDPKSGEGFTVIFNKVKEEKHIAATTFPTIPSQLNNQSSTHKTDTKSSKRCCCLF